MNDKQYSSLVFVIMPLTRRHKQTTINFDKKSIQFPRLNRFEKSLSYLCGLELMKHL